MRLLHSNQRIMDVLAPVVEQEVEKEKKGIGKFIPNPMKLGALMDQVGKLMPAMVKEVHQHIAPLTQFYIPHYPLKDE